MHPYRLTLILISVAAPALFGASKEMVQLQRDVTLIQEQLRLLQSALDTKMTEIKMLSQQSLEESKRANTAVTVLDRGIGAKLQEQQKLVAEPVAGVGAKIDQLANDFSTLREVVMELSSRLGKMQVEMRDVKDAISTIRNPPPPPPGVGAPTAADLPPPQQLYDKAQSDKAGGQSELALKQFQDFVNAYPNEPLAANAQYYIGEILYNRQEFQSAIVAFDLVLERYPDNIKTPDATYMKGLALLRSDQKASARKMFQEVVSKYPNSDVAPKAQTQLTALSGAAAPAAKKKTRR